MLANSNVSKGEWGVNVEWLERLKDNILDPPENPNDLFFLICIADSQKSKMYKVKYDIEIPTSYPVNTI